MSPDLFKGDPPQPLPAKPRKLYGKQFDCRRCGSSGQCGNICFLSDAHLRAYCEDNAERLADGLVELLVELPDNESRRLKINDWLAAGHWSPGFIESIRQRALTRYKAGQQVAA